MVKKPIPMREIQDLMEKVIWLLWTINLILGISPTEMIRACKKNKGARHAIKFSRAQKLDAAESVE